MKKIFGAFSAHFDENNVVQINTGVLVAESHDEAVGIAARLARNNVNYVKARGAKLASCGDHDFAADIKQEMGWVDKPKLTAEEILAGLTAEIENHEAEDHEGIEALKDFRDTLEAKINAA